MALSSSSPIREVFDGFLTHFSVLVDNAKRKKSSLDRYGYYRQHLGELGDLPVGTLSSPQVVVWYEDLEAAASTAVAHTTLSVVRSALSWARRRGYCTVNAASELGFEYSPARRPPLTVDQVRELMAMFRSMERRRIRQFRHSSQPHAMLAAASVPRVLQLLALTAARVGEGVSVRADRVHLHNRLIWVDAKKGPRPIVLDDAFRLVSRQHERVVAAGLPFLFPSLMRPLEPITVDAVERVFRETCSEHPHRLRHFAASESLFKGCSLFSVGRLLGHIDLSTTADVYAAYVVPEESRQAAETDGLFSAVTAAVETSRAWEREPLAAMLKRRLDRLEQDDQGVRRA